MMRIKEFSGQRFKGANDFNFDFNNGIVVFKAPNEGGKTSLRQAFNTLLFDSPKSTKSELKEFRRWGQPLMFELSMEFMADDVKYRLSKDFETKTETLENMNTEEKFTDKKTIQGIVEQSLGLNSDSLFKNTVYFSAEEIADVKDAVTLRNRLEERLCGLEGVSISSLIAKINEELINLNKGRYKIAKYPGKIKEAEDRLKELGQKKVSVEAKVKDMAQWFGELNNIESELQQVTQELVAKNSEYGRIKEWKETKTKLTEAQKQLEKLNYSFEQHNILAEQKRVYGEKLEEEMTKVNLLKEKIGKIVVFINNQNEIKNLENKHSNLGQTVDKIQEITKEIEVLRNSIKQEIMAEDTKNMQEIVTSLRSLKLASKNEGFSFELEIGNDFDYSLIADGVSLSTTAVDAQTDLVLDIKGIAKICIKNKNSQATINLEKQHELIVAGQELLGRFGFKTQEELQNAYTNQEKTKLEIKSKEGTVSALLAKSTLEKMVEEKNKALKELNQLKETSSVPDIEVNSLDHYKVELVRLETEYQDKNNAYQQVIGKLENMPSLDEIEKDKKDWAYQIYIAEVALEKMDIPSMSLEEIMRLENAIEVLNSREKNANDIRNKLETKLEMIEYGTEDLEALIEEIEYYENSREQLLRKELVLQKVLEMFQEARARTLNAITKEIDQKMRDYFMILTNNRYSNITINPENLEIQIFSKDKNSILDIDKELSSGTRDQAYLATRLALIPAVAHGKKPPIFLDDSLVFFDEDRRNKTFEILKDLSKEHQIFIFTCQDYYDTVADQIISW